MKMIFFASAVGLCSTSSSFTDERTSSAAAKKKAFGTALLPTRYDIYLDQ
jgi:hypothetical protein